MEIEKVMGGENGLPGERLAAQVLAAKVDRRALNALLRNYMPFIKKCVANVFFKGQSREDNLTDAMLAFAHSVRTYASEHGAFIQYAAVVIRNRLIDNARKEMALQRRFAELPESREGEDGSGWDSFASARAFEKAEEERNLRGEIEEVSREFARWGFSWVSLLKKCPKQERSRRVCLRAAEVVLSSPELLTETMVTRQLPASRLAETFPRKAIEKYRQYIAALIILSRGDYPYVYSFVPQLVIGEGA